MPFDPVSAAVSGAQGIAESAFNAWQSQRQMEFQRTMASTSHQREVSDLRAAGLNPLLSVNKGAAVPGGSSAQAVSPDIAQSGLQGGLQKHQTALMDAQTNSAVASAEQTKSQTRGTELDNAYKAAANGLNLAMLKNQVLTSNLSPQEKQKQIDLIDAQIQKTKADTSLTGWSAKEVQDRLKYGNMKGFVEPLRTFMNSAKGLSGLHLQYGNEGSANMLNHLDEAVKSGRVVPRSK